MTEDDLVLIIQHLTISGSSPPKKKNYKYHLYKSTDAYHCEGKTKTGKDCQRNATWHYAGSVYCKCHLPPKAKQMAEKGDYQHKNF
jgi:hypothetical protein